MRGEADTLWGMASLFFYNIHMRTSEKQNAAGKETSRGASTAIAHTRAGLCEKHELLQWSRTCRRGGAISAPRALWEKFAAESFLDAGYGFKSQKP